MTKNEMKRVNEKWVKMIKMLPDYKEKKLNSILSATTGMELFGKLNDYFFELFEKSPEPLVKVPFDPFIDEPNNWPEAIAENERLKTEGHSLQ